MPKRTPDPSRKRSGLTDKPSKTRSLLSFHRRRILARAGWDQLDHQRRCEHRLFPRACKREKKCPIPRLQSRQGILLGNMTSCTTSACSTRASWAPTNRSSWVAKDVWIVADKVSDGENLALSLSFLRGKMDTDIWDMKIDTAPGHDGWPVAFLRRF